MNAHFPTESLARRAARRLGDETVRVIEIAFRFPPYEPAGITQGFYVEDSEVQGVTLRPWERTVYEGPGYACSRDFA